MFRYPHRNTRTPKESVALSLLVMATPHHHSHYSTLTATPPAQSITQPHEVLFLCTCCQLLLAQPPRLVVCGCGIHVMGTSNHDTLTRITEAHAFRGPIPRIEILHILLLILHDFHLTFINALGSLTMKQGRKAAKPCITTSLSNTVCGSSA